MLSFAAGNAGGIAARCADRRGSAGGNQRLALYRGLDPCRLVTFFWYPIIDRLRSPVLVFDAAGLALFAVSGAHKALAFHAGPVAAALLGMLTGIGGGMVRDLLVAEVPTVLRTELYAVAALAGATVVVSGRRWGCRPPWPRPPARSSASGFASWPSGVAGACPSLARPIHLPRRDDSENADFCLRNSTWS